MKIKDKEFSVLLSDEAIQQRIKEMAKAIRQDYVGKTPLFVAILNGSFMFAADMLKSMDLPCEISFVKIASYQDLASTGTIDRLIGLNVNVFNRDIIILEDIVDSGLTITSVLKDIEGRGASSVEIASLLLKPEALKQDVVIKYLGFEIPDVFVVGYGLDYDGLGRNATAIYQIKA